MSGLEWVACSKQEPHDRGVFGMHARVSQSACMIMYTIQHMIRNCF